MRFLKIIAVLVVVVVAGGYGTYKYKNSTPPQLKEPNYFAIYKTQDMQPEGRIGVFISHLVMPEDMRMVDFHNLALKSMQYIPWPVNTVVAGDNGVILLDPVDSTNSRSSRPTRWSTRTATRLTSTACPTPTNIRPARSPGCRRGQTSIWITATSS